MDFLNAELSEVCCDKWLDANGNGKYDRGETGMSGVTIRLLDADGELVAAVETDEYGAYQFEGLRAGVYTVEELEPESYTATTAASVGFELTPGQSEKVDFHNTLIEVEAGVITPPIQDGGQQEVGSQQTLPVTGFELTYLLLIVGGLIVIGILFTSLGTARLWS